MKPKDVVNKALAAGSKNSGSLKSLKIKMKFDNGSKVKIKSKNQGLKKFVSSTGNN